MIKAIVSLSGGMDSASLLGLVCQMYKPEEVLAVSFRYPSKHNPYEQKAADAVAHYFGVRHDCIDVSDAFSGIKSHLFCAGGPIPEGDYEEDSMRQTVVPGRNSIFATILMGMAESYAEEHIVTVYLGVHAGDHHIYPDCRLEWVQAMARVYILATEGRVILSTPFIHDTKASIIKRGRILVKPVPYEMTRTCYKNQEVACGKCGSCQERLEAFHLNNLPDPLPYESREIFPKKGS